MFSSGKDVTMADSQASKLLIPAIAETANTTRMSVKGWTGSHGGVTGRGDSSDSLELAHASFVFIPRICTL